MTDHGFNTALIAVMKDEIANKLDAMEEYYNEMAAKAESSIKKLSYISSSMAISEAKVIVLEVAEQLMTKERDELLKELNKKIEETLAKS